jgi:hypothetical protein
MLESLVGEANLFDMLVNNELELNDQIVEQSLRESSLQLYLNEEQSVLTFFPTDLLTIHFGKFRSIDIITGLNKFGLNLLEEAKEKAYAKV